MARFDSAIALADRLITKNGEAAQLRRRVDGGITDPSTPFERADPTVQNFPTAAVWLGYTDSRIDGTLVRRGDQRVFIPAADLGTIEPNNVTDSLVRASGEVWNIIEVKPLSPNGQKIIYEAQVRK